MDTFREFLQQYFSGKLEPYIKSEAVPEENDGPVKVFTGKGLNFEVLSGALKANSVKNVSHNQKKIEILPHKVILQLSEALKGSGIGLQPLGKTINKLY